jgi:hypothetical protein
LAARPLYSSSILKLRFLLSASYSSIANGLARRLVALPAAIELLACVACHADIAAQRLSYHAGVV